MSPAAITIFCLLLGVAGTQGGPSRREPREAEDAHPRITYSKETIVKVGDEVKIDCAVEGVDLTGVDDFSVKWSKIDTEKPENSLPIAANDQIILFSNKYMIDHPADTYQYSLVIKEIKLEDTGIYRCTVNFDEKQKIDADVPVHIETAPFFTDDFTKTLTVTEGDAISIDCQPGGYPKPAVYWERLNQELPYYGGKFFKSNQFDLPLVSRDHKGHYVCYADNNVGDPANSHIILEVQYAPDVTVDKTQVFAVTDDEVLLECKVSANPEPDVAWFKDGEPILGGANYKMNKVELEEVTVMTLAVGKLTNDDFGTYSCRGVNVVGKTERTVEIRMKSPPLIVKQSRNEVLYDLERSNLRNALPVVIECEAEGDPAPEYRWNKNGAQLVWQADPRFDLEPGTGNLLISDPTRKDNGMYQCFAYNEMGTAVAEPVYLLNTTKIQFSNAGDSSDEYKFEAELGRPFKLSCPEPTGYPKVTMDWVKAVPLGDQIEMNFISDERTVVDPEGNLWFTHVTEADDSVKNNFQFICLGSNSFEPQDLSIASIIELTIKEPTDGAHNVAEESINVESFPMYTSPVNVTFRAQEENTLWCIYGGEPAPTVTWRRTDGSEFDDARFVTRNFGRTLVFKDTQVIDSGEYECTASNNVGEAKTWAMNVTVEQVPTFTSNLTSQTVQEGATVTFTCHTEATGEVTYTWTLNGRVIKPNGNSRRTVSGPKLVIVDVSIADIGNYACNASSDIGYAYGQAILNVIPGVRPVGGVGTAQCSEMDELVVKVATMQETIDVMKQLLMESHELTKHTHEKLCQLEESLLTKKETVNTNIKDSQPQEQQEQEQQQQQQEEQQHQQKQQQQPQQTQQQEEEEEITTEAIFRF